MTHLERYNAVTEVPTHEALLKLRAHIDELPDFRQPTQEEVYTAIENIFPALFEGEKSKLCEAFMASEADAAKIADGNK
jgi:hypothetical protein